MDIESKILRTIYENPNAILEGVRYDSKSNGIKIGKFMEKFIRSITVQVSNKKICWIHNLIIRDIEMIILKETMRDINEYFAQNRNKTSDTERATLEQFYLYSSSDDVINRLESFADRFIEVLAITNDERNKVIETRNNFIWTASEYKDIFRERIPSIAFPIFAYSGFYTYPYLPFLVKGERVPVAYLINCKYLSLPNITDTLKGDTAGVKMVVQAQMKLKFIFDELYKIIEHDNVSESNASLSLLLFNELTNLFDLYLHFQYFNSRYEGRFSKYTVHMEIGSKKLLEEIKLSLEDVPELHLLQGISLKYALVSPNAGRVFNIEFAYDSEVLVGLNKSISLIAAEIKRQMANTIDPAKTSNELEVSRYLFDKLKDKEPYKEIG